MSHAGTSEEADYVLSELQIYEKTFDLRKICSSCDKKIRPTVKSGCLFVDEDFPLEVAIKDRTDLEWKRPKDITNDPQLYMDGTERYDIGQGAVGTCWFLSMVASISEKPELLKRVLPGDAYFIGTDKYDGLFRCRFWQYGEWVDVFTDDFLPIIYGSKPWGAYSATDPNEMWVSLLEKGFARFHGSYDALYGGQPGDAYLAMTGGVTETIDIDETDSHSEALWKRVKRALQTGSLVSCVVPAENDGDCGLIGGHVYSLTDTAKVRNNDGEYVTLMRLRNPWGHTEWTGPWSDGSAEWNSLPPCSVDNPDEDDGEFWMQLGHFLHFFSDLTICSLMPDFDKDGASDEFNHITCVHGAWLGKSAAGFKNKLKNPKYLFSVPKEGTCSDGKVPLVLQIIQNLKDRKKRKKLPSIRCDLYKVIGCCEDTVVLEERGNETNMYTHAVQAFYRHRIEPGHYALIPSTSNSGVEEELMIRLFTSFPFKDIRSVADHTCPMACTSKIPRLCGSLAVDSNLCFSECLFGAWIAGVNAGGQIANKEFHSNPQFAFTIPQSDTSSHLVIFHVMQDSSEPQYPIGLRLLQINNKEMPVNKNFLYKSWNECIENTDNEPGKFVMGWSFQSTYVLKPGKYLALIHMNTTDQEKKYSIVFKSSIPLGLQSYQTGQIRR